MPGRRIQAIVDALKFDGPFHIVLPGGKTIRHGDGPPVFTLNVKTPAALRGIIFRSSLGFGNAYTRGEIDVEGDLQQVVLASFAAREQNLKGAWWGRGRYLIEFLARANTLAGSKRNIAAHYDLSNEFYALWLDQEMQYTCAYFAHADDTLEQAQRRKMDLVCRKLDLKAGDLVVEAGGGWGGLALHMARHWGVRVKSFNISRSQVEYARERAGRLGLGPEQVEYFLDDYRNIPRHVERCDKFASICMLEHVGRENYRAFHRLIGGLLRPGGLALLQFISRTRPSPISNPWLEKHVFPGYYNPSLGEVVGALEALTKGLQVVDVENMRFHYALTLRHWLDRFEQNAGRIGARWGEAVVRTFRLYLNGGLADFGHGRGTLIYQALLSNGCDNSAPLTRLRMFESLQTEDRPAPAAELVLA